ncbi:MAG: phosphoribosyl-ATP diphosphatase [Oscillospiraceae bacterium]|nr:phosphoribosyl-ATP diphosphatase [Oscillospiraceae bacterium]
MRELNVRCATEGQEIDQLFDVVANRRDVKDGQSYTAYLFEKGLDKILKKVGEACSLLLIAGKAGDKVALAAETADLFYHLMVMMVAKEIPMEAVAEELDRRSGKTGNLKVFHTTNVNS